MNIYIETVIADKVFKDKCDSYVLRQCGSHELQETFTFLKFGKGISFLKAQETHPLTFQTTLYLLNITNRLQIGL